MPDVGLPGTGVAVLSYADEEAVRACLKSVGASTLRPEVVLVVDNRSRVPVLAGLASDLPETATLQMPENVGYGAAMNAAVRELARRGCSTVVCLTQDARLAPEALGHLVGAVADGAVAAGPLLLRASDQETVWSAGGLLRGRRQAPGHRLGGRPRAEVDTGSQPVAWLDGAVLAVDVNAFSAVGGFREDYFLYWEDVDLCRRLAPGRVVCQPSARAWQEPSFVPPYLAARNRVLWLVSQRAGLGLLGLALEVLAQAGRDCLQWCPRRASLRLRGLADGFRRRLDRSIALERP